MRCYSRITMTQTVTIQISVITFLNIFTFSKTIYFTFLSCSSSSKTIMLALECCATYLNQSNNNFYIFEAFGIKCNISIYSKPNHAKITVCTDVYYSDILVNRLKNHYFILEIIKALWDGNPQHDSFCSSRFS